MITKFLRKTIYLTKINWYAFKVSFLPKIGLQIKSKKHHLDSSLIVSLTSYPKRFDQLHLTLLSLLRQTVKPDEIVLWIAKEDMSKLPTKVKALEKKGISIFETEDILSYKKIIPALKKYPNDFIITVDDDLYYPPNLVEELVNKSKENPGFAIANRTHLITLNEDGAPNLYSKWRQLAWNNQAYELNFLTGVCGVLYPPNIFDDQVLDELSFMKIAPRADDVWLYWMLRMNGKSVLNTGYAIDTLSWPGSQDTALWKTNVYKSGNDDQIISMVQKYGFPIPLTKERYK